MRLSEQDFNEYDGVKRLWFVGGYLQPDESKTIVVDRKIKKEGLILNDTYETELSNSLLFTYWEFNDIFGKQFIYSINVRKNVFKADLDKRIKKICNEYNLSATNIDERSEKNMRLISEGIVEIGK